MNISISPFMAQVKLPHCTNFVKALVPIYGFPIKIGYYFFVQGDNVLGIGPMMQPDYFILFYFSVT